MQRAAGWTLNFPDGGIHIDFGAYPEDPTHLVVAVHWYPNLRLSIMRLYEQDVRNARMDIIEEPFSQRDMERTGWEVPPSWIGE